MSETIIMPGEVKMPEAIDANVFNGRVVEENMTTGNAGKTVLTPDFAQQAVAQKKNEVEPITVRSFSALSPERQQRVLAFVPQIDLKNTQLILNYGDSVIKEVSKMCSDFISDAKGTDEEEAVKNQLAKSLGEVAKVKAKKSFFKDLFKNASEKYEDLKKRYMSLDEMLQSIEKTLVKQVDIMYQNLVDQDKYIELNEKAVHLFEDYLVAGQLALDNAKTNLLPGMTSDGSLYNSEKANLERNVSIFEKKLADVEMSRGTTMGLCFLAAITKETSMNNIIVLNDNIKHNLLLIKQECYVALLHARNKISNDVSTAVMKASEDMLQTLAKDIKSESLEIAKKSREGFLDPKCLEALVNEVRDCTSQIKGIYENSSQTLNNGLEQIRSAEKQLTDMLNNQNNQNSAGNGTSTTPNGKTGLFGGLTL